MAQQDTGMGWSAKSEWLKSSSGTLCEIVQSALTLDFPTIISSTTPPWSSCVALGQYCLVDGNTAYLGIWGGTAPEVNVAIVKDYAYNKGWWAFYFTTDSARQPGGSFKFATADESTEYNAGGGAVSTPTYDAGTGIYYSRAYPMAGYGSADRLVMSSGTIPVFETIQAALEYFKGTSQIYYKLNSGYAVACVASWYTPNGEHLLSPVLISTNPNYTAISADGQTPADDITTFDFLKDGLRFYMSIIQDISAEDATLSAATIQRAELEQFAASAPVKVFRLLVDNSFSNVLVSNSPDPYQEGDGSEESGGDGEEDNPENVDFTDPPSTSIGATGLLTIFCPNLYQLQSLGNYMWSTFDVDNWRKIIANPMDAILGLHTIPIPAVVTGTKAVKVAGIDTTIDMSYTTVRYIRRSMGTCEIPKKWGAYLDYSPYTKIAIFLPFIGFKELDADDVMGQTISLQYIIDILTGACVAELKCGDTILYSWSGNCANEVPISGSDWRGAIASAIGIAATVAGTALVTGGATAPMAASMVASVGANSMNLKPTINRSGAISGSAGYMSQKRPYIIRSIPNLVIPADQNKFIGYPSFVTTSLGSLTGYNEIASIHLEGIPATGNELAEIETLLKGGVIF